MRIKTLRVLGVFVTALIALSGAGCSKTHEARIPSNCDIPSLKEILPDLTPETLSGANELMCTSLYAPDDLIDPNLSADLKDDTSKRTYVYYFLGDKAEVPDADLKSYKAAWSRVEVYETNGCKALFSQTLGTYLGIRVYCKGFGIDIITPKPWEHGLELASAAIVGLIQ